MSLRNRSITVKKKEVDLVTFLVEKYFKAENKEKKELKHFSD